MKLFKKENILLILLGIFVARAGFYGIYPFSLGFFTAVYIENRHNKWIMIPVIIGVISVITPLESLTYIFAIILTIGVRESKFLKKVELPQIITYMLPPVWFGTCSFIFNFAHLDKDKAIMISLEILLVCISTIVFKKGLKLLNNQGDNHIIDNEEIISMIIIIALSLYAFPNIDLMNFAPLETLVYFIIILFTYKYGAGQGTIAAVISSLVMYLKGYPITKIVLYPVMAIIPSIFSNLGKVPFSIIYVSTIIVIDLINDGNAYTIKEIGAVLSAVLLFLLLPNEFMYREGLILDKTRCKSSVIGNENAKDLFQHRINGFADTFLRLSKTINNTTGEQIIMDIGQVDIDNIFEELSENMCRTCKNCKHCWEEEFDATYEATCFMFKVAEENGYIDHKDIPINFLETCIIADKYVSEANKGFELAKINRNWSNKLKENRDVIADQLEEVSNAMSDFSKELTKDKNMLEINEGRLTKAFRKAEIGIKDIVMIESNDKRKEISFEAICKRGCITTKEAAIILSGALGTKFLPSESSKTVITKEGSMLLFIEDTKYKVLTGVARGIKEKVSGDNFSIMKLNSGDTMIALSDGMGTGKKAFKESDLVITLLEQFMDAGFNARAAIKLINSSLVLKNREQSFTTVDLSVINLYTGICQFIKIGASTTFIKRGTWVETICSTTMPIGIINEVDFDSASKKLYDGDVMIMVTDGVLDSIEAENKEEVMKNIIMDIDSKNAQEISNLILEKMLVNSNYMPVDDMTIVTSIIWSK